MQQQWQWAAERAGMWSLHYVDRLRPQLSNWLPGLYQSHKGSPHCWAKWLFVCDSIQRRKQRYSFALYNLLRGDSLLVLLCRSCSGFWRPCRWDSLDLRETVLRLGETTCFGLGSFSSSSSRSSCVLQLACYIWERLLVYVYKLFDDCKS